MTPERIVIPVALQRYVDAPPIACRQRDLARLLAAACQCEMHFISAQAPLHLAPQAETVEEKLQAFVKPLVSHGFDVKTAVLEGRPRDVVKAYVQQVKADLVILGTHTKRSPLELSMGNNATALMADLPCEVVLIKPTVEDAEKAREMMIPDYPLIFTYV